MIKKIVLTFALVFCLSFSAIIVEGQATYEVVAVYGSAPTVDGSINVGEWDDAASVSFDNTEVFVKQNGVNLYIAFNVLDATLNDEDYVGLLFDINHDDGTTFGQDDIFLAIQLNREPVEIQLGVGMLVSPFGWVAEISYTSVGWQAEFVILYPKISVTAGVEKSLGVAFIVQDFPGELPCNYYTWPPNLIVEESPKPPSTWGEMTSTGYNWIPEFPPFLFLPLFMIATLLTIVLYRRKLVAYKRKHTS